MTILMSSGCRWTARIGGVEFRAVIAINHCGEKALGNGFPMSNNIGCDCTAASYSADTTRHRRWRFLPHTASSGVRDAAVIGKAHNPNRVEGAISVQSGKSALAMVEPAAKLRRCLIFDNQRVRFCQPDNASKPRRDGNPARQFANRLGKPQIGTAGDDRRRQQQSDHCVVRGRYECATWRIVRRRRTVAE
jgi:hypothetical protein